MKSLSTRGRVALALAAAERALARLRGQEPIYSMSHAALDDAWAWEQNDTPGPEKLYEHIFPISDRFKDVQSDPGLEAAHAAIVSALYYTTRQAAAVERRKPGYSRRRELPNDMREISEDDLKQCLEEAAAAAEDPADERNWQQETAARLAAAYPDDGSSVPPSFFVMNGGAR